MSGRGCCGEPAADRTVVYGTKAFANVALRMPGCSLRKGSARTSRRSASSRSRRRAGISRRSPARPRRQLSRNEELRAAAEPGRSSCSTRSTSRSGQRQSRRGPCPRPGHAPESRRRRPGDPHRPPRLQVRPRRGRRRRGRPHCTRPRTRRRRAPCARRFAALRRQRAPARGGASRPVRRPQPPELDWVPRTIDIGGGFGIRHVQSELEPRWRSWCGRSLPRRPRVGHAQARGAAPDRRGPGRALVGPTAFTLYSVGAVKRAGDRRYVAIDGGMSDNPRPQLYQRALHGRAREPGGRGARRRLHDRGQALRVGRRADRTRGAAGAAARRPDRRPRDRRLHARDGWTTTVSRGGRPCWSAAEMRG